jgi:hypothetical protein
MIDDPDLFDQKKEIMDHFFNSIKFLDGRNNSDGSTKAGSKDNSPKTIDHIVYRIEVVT